MPSIKSLQKAKLTITINRDLAIEIDKIAKKRKKPRSKIMEEMLLEMLSRIRKQKIEDKIENYYLSLTEEDKKEDREWTNISAVNAGRTWDD